jgi:hypothetical protein
MSKDFSMLKGATTLKPILLGLRSRVRQANKSNKSNKGAEQHGKDRFHD